jgi:sugar transferase (PEP-CTERM system associated)
MFKLFRQYYSTKVIFLFLTESLLIAGALFASIHLRFYRDPFEADDMIQGSLFSAEMFLIVSIGMLCFYYNDLYDLTAVCRRSELVVRLIQAIGGWCLLLALVSMFYPQLVIGRGILLITVLMSAIAVCIWRELSAKLGFIFHNKERILILGSGRTGIELCRKLLTRSDLNFEIVGFLDEDPSRVGERLVNPSIIGTFEQLSDIVSEKRVDRVVVALPDRRGRMPVQDLLRLRLQGVVIEDVHTLYESVTGRISLESVRPSWMIFSNGFQKFRWQLLFKRCFDVVFAGLLLVFALPFMGIVAICIKLDSKGSVLFKQERVGQFGRVFTLMKFRSMGTGAEKDGVPQWAQQNDVRVTQFGRFIRKFRIDELPQLFNIIRGDMSFVGPRPERPYFVERLEKNLAYYRERHVVKPGLTGWAQVRFPYASTEEETRDKLEYDFFYIKNFSVMFDIAIVFQTAKIVLFGQGSR